MRNGRPRAVVVRNAQREAPVDTAHMARLAHRVIRQLRLCLSGALVVTFISSRRMRTLNRRFCHHDWVTDVLSFRYDGEPIVGEILIAPRQAQRYARAHRLPYAQELSRYVVHGLLHWLGHEDRTAQERRTMRSLEDRLLSRCGMLEA